MKKKSIVTIPSIILITYCFNSQAFDLTAIDDNLNLEPCINGGVSSSGLYETQALEEASSISLASVLTSYDENIDLEPCIDGGVSASGLYETQALEEASSRFNDDESVEIAAIEGDC